MVVTPLGMVTEVREVQEWNAEFPMVVMLSGMVTESGRCRSECRVPDGGDAVGMVTDVREE